MNVLVSIVNYNSADLTIGCLRSLEIERETFPCFHVRVVDNKSTDSSIDVLSAIIGRSGWSDWVTLQPLDKNGGFAYGNNAAIGPDLSSQSKPDYILLLNPDTIVRPGAIRILIEWMETHQTVGIGGSRLEDPDGTVQRSAFRFHSIAGEFERGVRLGLVSKLLAKRMVAPPPPEHAKPCDWVAGAAMAIRTSVFEKAGLMDEKYFMYFEEVDFCRQAKKAGWPCWYVPQSRVVHLVGAVSEVSDSRKHRKRRPKYWFESRRRYFVKNHGWVYAALADIAFVFGYAMWRLRRMVQGKVDTDPPYLLSDSITESVFVRGWAI